MVSYAVAKTRARLTRAGFMAHLTALNSHHITLFMTSQVRLPVLQPGAAHELELLKSL